MFLVSTNLYGFKSISHKAKVTILVVEMGKRSSPMESSVETKV